MHIIANRISGRVSIKIKDNGIGIESKYINKIFEMFFRATNEKSGSGLGLYIVKETLKKLNGKIKVLSTFGKGTEFIIDIPESN
jgi:signal transduction histidine kinase